MRKLRLLPLLILIAAAMFTLKLGSIWQDIAGLNTSLETRASLAAEDQPAADGSDTPSETADAAADTASDPAASPDPAASGGAAVTAAPAEADDNFDPRELSQSEIRLLQALAQRRKDLDAREVALNQREALLKAAEQRVVDKQAEFVAMRDEVKKLLDELDVQEAKKIKGLVKLYESMKPKDAARILNDLELSVLMRVVQRMNVRRLAPVLAAMDGDKARAVTRALADREKRQNNAPPTLADNRAAPPRR